MPTKPESTLAWHFVGATLRDDSPVPPDGTPISVDPGKLELCKHGLHGSVRLIDALQYAPGNTICRTRHSGQILRGDDKMCSETRTIIWRVDGTDLLCVFARSCALDVAHMWDMPPVVREYLETGREDLRAAANDAAYAAYAAANAARVAANAAANAAIYATNAARVAANAARVATYAANAAAYAARVAANAAANAAIYATNAARVAQNKRLTAAYAAQNKRLTPLVMAAHKDKSK
jgi:hypothetical protein